MENLPTPLSRVELYLAKACGMDVTTPEPGPGIEPFLYAIAYNTTPPVAGYLTEEWLAYVQGVIPQKTLKIEGACLIGNEKVDVRYFAVAAGVPGATLPPKPQNRKEEYWAYIATHRPAPGILKYVTGKYFYLTDVVSGIEELQYVKGDTFQQTYSGKNIIDFATIDYSAANSGSATRNGATFTVTGASNGNYGGIQFTQSNLQLKTDTTYTFSATVTSTTNTNGSMVYVNSAMSSTGSQILGSYAKAGERTVVTFTTPSSITNSASIRLYPATVDAVAVFTDIMVEESSTATTYEPYTGGIPAPNPDYPQDIQVVTGEQTVNISDGVRSEDYTLDLGAIELCKIGTYQDYIYKSGDDWYVHKECTHYAFTGDEDWQLRNTQAGGISTFSLNFSGYKFEQGACDNALCNYCINLGVVSAATMMYTKGIGFSLYYHNGYNGRSLYINTIDANLPTFKTNISGKLLYYPLDTPTDTKITDATLISQLDALNSSPLPKPIASIALGATGTNLTPYLTIAYYGSEE